MPFFNCNTLQENLCTGSCWVVAGAAAVAVGVLTKAVGAVAILALPTANCICITYCNDNPDDTVQAAAMVHAPQQPAPALVINDGTTARSLGTARLPGQPDGSPGGFLMSTPKFQPPSARYEEPPTRSPVMARDKQFLFLPEAGVAATSVLPPNKGEGVNTSPRMIAK